MQTNRKSDIDVLVVGAGIAGLCCAYRISKAGLSVKVLEASERCGGRMTTDEFGGFLIDRGAQFLSSNYSTLLPLISELGLETSIRQISPWAAIVRGGKPRKLKASDPFGVLRHGMITPAQLMKLGWFGWQIRKVLRSFPLNDYSRWADFDNETAADWSHRQIGRRAAEYMVEPLLDGLFFQEPEIASKAFLHVVFAFYFRRSESLTLQGGIGRLAEALAGKLDVTYNAPVKSVRSAGDSVLIVTSQEEYGARYVVLATTAPAARKLYAEADENERRLLATNYSSNVNIALMTHADYQVPPSLSNIYGVLIPRVERQHIAAITIETNKSPDRAANGKLFHVMLCGRSSAAMLQQTDTQILDAVKPEIERFLPGIIDQISKIRIYRWPEAMPLSPLGRAKELRQYRENSARILQRVFLAGDYMSTPFTDGAAESGTWVASMITEARRREFARVGQQDETHDAVLDERKI